MAKNDIKGMLLLLEEAHKKKDYEAVTGYFLELGKAYMEEGNIQKAIYYLERFDNFAGGDDDMYMKFKKEEDKVNVWLAGLEMEQRPYVPEIQEHVLKKSETLNDLQKIQWIILTMARFCTLFNKISVLPGIEGFGKLGEIINYFSSGIYDGLDKGKEDEILDYYDMVNDVFDSSIMCDYTMEIEIPGQESFVLADLENGNFGTDLFSMAYYEIQSFIFDSLLEGGPSMDFVACGIMADYYYRTSDSDIRNEPKIREEKERIFSDYEFIKKEPDKDSFNIRVRNYKSIMLV